MINSNDQLIKIALGNEDYKLLENMGYIESFQPNTVSKLSKKLACYYKGREDINSMDIMVHTLMGIYSEDCFS